MKIKLKTNLFTSLAVFVFLLAPIQGVYAAFPGQNGKVLYANIKLQGEDLENPSFTKSINAMNTDGTGKQTLIETNREQISPEWSADGRKITWSDNDGYNVQDIFVANADGTNKRRVTNLSDNEDVSGYSGGAIRPSFSPDGSRIIYEKSFNGFEDPTCTIHIINVDGTNDNEYDQAEGECRGAPQISSNGSKIAFFRANGNNLELYTMNINGENSQLLTSVPWSENGRYTVSQGNLSMSIDWSPDSSQIIYSRQDGNSFGETSILIIPSTGGEPQELKAANMNIQGSVYNAVSYGSPKFTPEGDVSFVELQGTLDGVEDIENSTVTGTSSLKVMDVSSSEEATFDSIHVSNASFIYFYTLYYAFVSPSVQPVHNQASVYSPETTKRISLQTPEGTTVTCSSAVKESTHTKQDGGYNYPLGLVDFCFDTESQDNEVSLTFVTDLKPSDVKARKYNSTNQTYFDIPNATITETTLEGQHALRVTYTITDNGQLDLDPETGKIVDPVGLAVTAGSLASTGESIKLFAVLGLGLVIVAGGIVFAQRKSAKKK